MIKCIINGSVAYPEVKNNIKITYANQYVQDSGNYTYQITFPMAIPENRRFFRNVSRFEVGKQLPDYEDCQLFIDNRLLISGKGTVTSITQDSVKLQIVGGKSRIKYNSEMTRHFIDEIEAYDVVDTTFQRTDTPVIEVFVKRLYVAAHRIGSDTDTELSQDTFIGKRDQQGRPMYAFNPTWDETNDRIVNRIIILDGTAWLWRPAVQPSLMYALRKVLEYEGFTLQRNDLDTDPWNRLFICSARTGLDIRLALPHWSVYTFIEEVRKLFNVSFIFHETTKTVDIVRAQEVTAHAAVSYEALDEFSAEHDDEGLKNIIVSNLRYDFPDSANRSLYEILPPAALKKFKVLEFETESAANTYFGAVSTKEQMTTIYKVGDTYHIGIIDEDKYGDNRPRFMRVGHFMPLVRNIESDDYEEFSIVPVAMYSNKLRELYADITFSRDQNQLDSYIEVPSIANDKETEGGTVDTGDDEYYVTVQDVLSDESLLESKEENTDEKMQVMFQASMLLHTYPGHGAVYPNATGDSPYRQYRYPWCFTGEYYDFARQERASLSLHDEGGGTGAHIASIGDFHEAIPVDVHNLQTIRFITDDIPDPSKIFVFRNKKYICQKVELEVGDSGVNRIKTGYFYEMGD